MKFSQAENNSSRLRENVLKIGGDTLITSEKRRIKRAVARLCDSGWEISFNIENCSTREIMQWRVEIYFVRKLSKRFQTYTCIYMCVYINKTHIWFGQIFWKNYTEKKKELFSQLRSFKLYIFHGNQFKKYTILFISFVLN